MGNLLNSKFIGYLIFLFNIALIKYLCEMVNGCKTLERAPPQAKSATSPYKNEFFKSKDQDYFFDSKR